MYPTVSDMLVLTSVLAGTVAAAAFIGALVRQGFRHGDVAGDAHVRARALECLEPGTGGRWLEVTIATPSAATALVALGLGRTRLSRLGSTATRHTAGRRARLSLGERMVGAVPGGESAEFHVWAEGDLRRLTLLVSVGTPGRLRLHRLPMPGPLPDHLSGVGQELPDPRESVAP